MSVSYTRASTIPQDTFPTSSNSANNSRPIACSPSLTKFTANSNPFNRNVSPTDTVDSQTSFLQALAAASQQGMSSSSNQDLFNNNSFGHGNDTPSRQDIKGSDIDMDEPQRKRRRVDRMSVSMDTTSEGHASSLDSTLDTHDDEIKVNGHLSGNFFGNGNASSGETNKKVIGANSNVNGGLKKTVKGKKSKEVPKERKKKASRACAACQKAHLTCDDDRPCRRCIKRGTPDQCQDGHRKKAKYLADYPDELVGRGSYPTHEAALNFQSQAQDTEGVSVTAQNQSLTPTQQQPQNESLNQFNYSEPTPPNPLPMYDPAAMGVTFGSEAANLEYSILSSMLGGNGFPVEFDNPTVTTPPPFRDSNSTFASPTFNENDNLINTINNNNTNGGSNGNANHNFSSTTSSTRLPQQTSTNSPTFFQSSSRTSFSTFPPASSPTNFSPTVGLQMNMSPLNGGTVVGPPEERSWRKDSPPLLSSTGVMSPQDVYRKVTKPYAYTEAYHWLIGYLRENFEKNDILRIVRALSIFRPSLIALQMPLTEEDEVFVERCFQRTLIEYDKLIAMSGTPTVLFRRTGELCLVGNEFCLLTGYNREELLGRKKFIYEIFDHTSTVEYFEAFAMHAFENTTQAVMTTCVLLTPEKKPVPCTFCFTIKRDLFNCPQIVVGQFLPILGS